MTSRCSRVIPKLHQRKGRRGRKERRERREREGEEGEEDAAAPEEEDTEAADKEPTKAEKKAAAKAAKAAKEAAAAEQRQNLLPKLASLRRRLSNLTEEPSESVPGRQLHVGEYATEYARTRTKRTEYDQEIRILKNTYSAPVFRSFLSG